MKNTPPITNVLDTYVHGNTAVVGPNYRPRDDPTALYLSVKQLPKQITIVDKRPEWTLASHGNYESHINELKALQLKGMKLQIPQVVVADVRKPFEINTFDTIVDHTTFKCIWYSSTTDKAAPKTSQQVAQNYANALRKNGTLTVVYCDSFEHIYTEFSQALAKHLTVTKLDDKFSAIFQVGKKRFNHHFDGLEVLIAKKTKNSSDNMHL